MAGAGNGNGPTMAVVEAVYDEVLALTDDSEEGRSLQHRFYGELTRVEVAMLRERSSRALPTFRHPLPAMRAYRAFMCDARVYDEIGNAKIRVRDRDLLEVRYWHCRYGRVCAARERRICMRTHSLTEAAELMSPATFKRIEELDFSEEGNCMLLVRMGFEGDLRDIEPEEKVVEQHMCDHLTREEADEFFLRSFMVGAEYAVNHTGELKVEKVLPDLARRLRNAGVTRGPLAKSKVMRAALAAWQKGQNAFVKPDEGI